MKHKLFNNNFIIMSDDYISYCWIDYSNYWLSLLSLIKKREENMLMSQLGK